MGGTCNTRVSWEGHVTCMENMGKESELLIENTKRGNLFETWKKRG
jgi:hypothetical protein